MADRAGKGSGVEIAEQSACDGVALTGAVFEGGAVEDVDFAALVVDEAASLEGAGAEGDGRAARTDHLREELLGEAEVRLPEAVGDHEEPAREPFLDIVEAVAGGHLTDQQGLILDMPQHVAAYRLDEEELVVEALEVDAIGGGVNLHEALRGAAFGAEQVERFGGAFATAEADLHTVTIFHGGHDRGDTGGDEVEVRRMIVGGVEGGADGEGYVLRAGEEHFAEVSR